MGRRNTGAAEKQPRRKVISTTKGAIMNDRLMHIEDFAKIIDRTPAAARYMIHTGKAPRSAKIGGRRMFRESDIYEWINAQFEMETSK